MRFFPEREERSADGRDLQRSRTPRWSRPPEDELPHALAETAVLATTDNLALLLAGVRAYSDGALFLVEWRLRRLDEDDAAWAALVRRVAGPRLPGEQQLGALRLGVELADGERLVADGESWWLPGELTEPDGHVLGMANWSGGGSDDTQVFSGDLWLWPLPPEGPVTLAWEWPAFGLTEGTRVLSGGRIRDAAVAARPIWG
ncbi:hypothetical protein LLS1_10650 [Leifsonia sp. LS1]|uniref:hypothetical protein n=1 Tax=Leifsonia sp. LS1 TaxID=2828483 RepID=UPI001CFF28B9|nr:hypothetical protein [Leifsonia sp. LS1]GIT79396.1 hypothetical protein LLS1_10650 [Leifsonia sp. LS1]